MYDLKWKYQVYVKGFKAVWGGKRQVDRQIYKTQYSLRNLGKNTHSNSLIIQTKIKVNNYFGIDSPINTVSLCKIIHMHKYLQNLTRDHFTSFTVLSSSFPLVIYIVHTSKAWWYFTGLKSFGLSHKTVSFPGECVI